MQKFLLIQTAFIGDVVLATALIEKLHQFYPDAKIDFVVRKGNEGLLTKHPFLNETLIWDKKAKKYRQLFSLLQKIRKNKYDVVVNVQRFAATGLLTAFSGAKTTIGFNKNPLSFLFSKTVIHQISTPGYYIHEVERNQQLIEEITDSVALKPRLFPSKEDFEEVKKYQGAPYICIAPASVWFTKQYPAEKWAGFLNHVPSDTTAFLLGAASDVDLCNTIISSTENKRVINLAGKLTFLQSAALQKQAKMNFVNDSAPMHFASAVNAPVAAIYCSTVPSFGFGPLSDVNFIIQTNELLSCKPCGLHGYQQCPLGHFKCAHTINDQQLVSVLYEQAD